MVLFISLEGSATERGVQQGSILKEKMRVARKEVFYSQLFKEMKPRFVPVPVAVFGLGLIGKGKIAKAIEKHVPQQHEKLLGIAKGAGVSPRLAYGLHFIEIMAGNPRTSYAEPLVQAACSMLFALPPATAGKQPIFGRNYDFPAILQPYQMVRYEKPSDDRFATITVGQYPLAGTHAGMNQHGLAIGYNYGRSWKQDPLDYRKEGVPTMLVIQEALETCKTTREVIDYLTGFPARTNGAHYGIIDARGDAAVVETTATRHAIRTPVDGIMAHTNMYQTDELRDANVPDDVMWKYKGLEVPYTRSPKERFARASALLEEARGTITLDTFKAILRDHAGREPDDFTICTHGATGITLASILVDPVARVLWVTDTQPCKVRYSKFAWADLTRPYRQVDEPEES